MQAEPGNQAAKYLLAVVLEQIGYRQENPDLTLTIKGFDPEQTMMGQKTIMTRVVSAL